MTLTLEHDVKTEKWGQRETVWVMYIKESIFPSSYKTGRRQSWQSSEWSITIIPQFQGFNTFSLFITRMIWHPAYVYVVKVSWGSRGVYFLDFFGIQGIPRRETLELLILMYTSVLFSCCLVSALSPILLFFIYFCPKAVVVRSHLCPRFYILLLLPQVLIKYMSPKRR
jgi:hypothetical protein